MNARELLHFLSLRLCERSQWEIRELAERMLKEVKEIAPILFEKAGPRCEELGYCPEGELTCGRYPLQFCRGNKKEREKEEIINATQLFSLFTFIFL